MSREVAKPLRITRSRTKSPRALSSWLFAQLPSGGECGVALLSAISLIISFPNFDLWLLAWIALVPLLLLVARRPAPWPAFLLGWLAGSVFFYGTCYWLTYSMIHFGGIPFFLAFLLLIPGALVLGLFPAAFAWVLARAIKKWGTGALMFAPILWVAMEKARLESTGQLWNAIGYSQAYHPRLIQSARFGGVYLVGFLILTFNAAIALPFLKRDLRAIRLSMVGLLFCLSIVLLSQSGFSAYHDVLDQEYSSVVAIQPNVPMDLTKSTNDLAELNERHFEMSEQVLRKLSGDAHSRLLIWPESPMNFAYGSDSSFRSTLGEFARRYNSSILLNSQEAAPNGGIYNSAVLINQQGTLSSQYDKIRLLPFGEYVPLPQWLPGADLIRGVVGDFTAGTNYPLMSVGNVHLGVFICIESAYPSIARRFADQGADALINISNDGYLGPTAVMRQHLANGIFRAVENNRPLVRVTNTGISAFIRPNGEVLGPTSAFQQEVRIWKLSKTVAPRSFYTEHGDVFAVLCAAVTLFIFLWSFRRY